ncbi:acetate/propionate family kinase [Azospirillum oryzae]|uniref:Acetate kinase n=1 Tax=Azospirillum oryzae TaxID=286727 RepID=A0A6N1AQH6_9PROT|nr:acetate/propionate family kinase [Azospirillum oryzae]KAA0591408.1 acetate/propionate family kinase [Azospirillum oryzae]QKS52697.1 acetate/propionate family kinase [Azospirillum oryzae]GLR79342.1 acetate kinase [Azospirillum oryzae]
MSNAILVINAGSSSLKFSVFRDHGGGDPVVTVNGQISGIGTQPEFEAKDAQRRPLAEKSWGAGEPSDRTALLSYLLDWIEERLEGATLIAAGHRVVHGGVRHAAPVLLTSAVLDELDGLVPLAPLHQPHNLAAIRALAEAHPELPQVACFDTAFHRNQPWQAQTFAIPRELTEEGVRRYGFHGLSYEYISRRLPEIAPELSDSRVVVAHLGSGASMCAIHGGRSVDSTMGFTALDGLPMGTRCGTIDPGVLIYLMRKGMDAGAIEKLLYNKSGLLGVSGISNDMRALLESSDPHAQEAVELFCFRIAKETGALAASMGGVDAVVFTAGIGERSAPVRARVGDKLAWMGVEIDAAANEANAAKISAPGSRLPVYVVPTDEERMIALHTRKVLTGR